MLLMIKNKGNELGTHIHTIFSYASEVDKPFPERETAAGIAQEQTNKTLLAKLKKDT